LSKGNIRLLNSILEVPFEVLKHTQVTIRLIRQHQVVRQLMIIKVKDQVPKHISFLRS